MEALLEVGRANAKNGIHAVVVQPLVSPGEHSCFQEQPMGWTIQIRNQIVLPVLTQLETNFPNIIQTPKGGDWKGSCLMPSG